MTREEAIKVLLQHSEHWKRLLTENICSKEEGSQTVKAFNVAINALEQESVLDKIRAEIEQNAYPIVHGVNNHEKGMTLYGILQVIDKYRGES